MPNLKKAELIEGVVDNVKTQNPYVRTDSMNCASAQLSRHALFLIFVDAKAN
ncbi:MAG: hypothetical protein PUP91_03195 [Rhizonema sp. PD37]|nr:hypothetical protein [Rhizonema sp. PD37]